MSPERSSMDEQSRELEELLLQRERPSPLQVWNRLGRSERAHAVRSFLAGHPEGRVKLNGLLAQSLSYRPQTIRKWPEDRLVGVLSTLQIRNGEAAMDLLVHGQLAPDRRVAAALLDRLGIQHRNGRVDATEKLDASGPAAREAAEGVAHEFGTRAVALCFLVYRLERAPLADKAREWLEPTEHGDGSGREPAATPAPVRVEPRTPPRSGDQPPAQPDASAVEPSGAAVDALGPPEQRPAEPGDVAAAETEALTAPMDEVVATAEEEGASAVPPGGNEAALPEVAAVSSEPRYPSGAAPSPEPASPKSDLRSVESAALTPSVTPARYEPTEDDGVAIWLTTLDRLLQKAAAETWREIAGALSKDALDDAVDEFVTLNAHRPQSQFHAGHRDALFARTLDPGRKLGDPARRRWYWSGAVTGFALREAWAEIVRAAEQEQVVRDFGTGDAPPAKAAVTSIVKAFTQEGRSARLAGLLRSEAVTASPGLFDPLLEAATDLLRANQEDRALALLELLMNAAETMEVAGEAPGSRALCDTRRRAAHCLRVLHEHERARRLLRDLLEEDDDSNVRAMIEADLGLLDGEFTNMESVELPLREKHFDDFVGRLERGEERFRRSATAGESYSAHGNYLLGVLWLARAVQSDAESDWQAAAMHLRHARTRFRQRGTAYSQKFVARTDLYFAIARAQRLQPEGLAHASVVFAEAVRDGARLPEYLVRPSLEAFTEADDGDLRCVVSAMIGTADERVLDELTQSKEALKHGPTLVDEVWRRSKSEDRSAPDRATDLRASLRGFMAQKRHDEARGALDRLEELAGAGVGVAEFLGILEDGRRFDPAWSPEEALIARARCHEAAGDFVEAVGVLRPRFFRALAQDSPWALDDAQGILERVRGYGIPRDEWRDLQDHYKAKAPGHDPAGRSPRPGQVIRVLVVGAGEQLAKNEEQVRQKLKNTHPHIHVRFVRTGWSANWMPAFEAFDRVKGSHQALVLMRFVRTNFGRRVRKAWPGDRPWRFCWGEGQKLLTRTIVRAAAAASTKTG